jgi:hypothetical protein
MRFTEKSARILLSILRDHDPAVGQPFSIGRSLVTRLLQRLNEAELIAGILYARRYGWLIIEGSDIHITKAGLQAVARDTGGPIEPPRPTSFSA